MAQQTLAQEEIVEAGSLVPHIHWGAVIAGYILAAAVGVLFYLLGSAIGISALDIANADAISKGVAIGTIFWAFFTWIASLFLGGMFAGWVAGETDRVMAGLHGVSVWAVTHVMAIILGTVSVGGLIATGTQGAQNLASALAALGPAAINQVPAGSDSALQSYQAQFKEGLSQAAADMGGDEVRQVEVRRAIDRLSPQLLGSIVIELAQGDEENAKNLVMIHTGLSREDVESMTQGLAAQTEQFRFQLSQTAEKAAKYTSAALWTLFFGSILGLLAAYYGGRMGCERLINTHFTYAAKWKHSAV